MSGEHQTWLNQVTRLQIPIPTGDVPSTAALKNWAISWAKSEELWIKPRDDDDDRFLDLHQFNTRQEEFMPFVMASLIPGGDFVVILYSDGQIDLQEIKIGSNGKWNLQDVAQYKQYDLNEFRTALGSLSYGRKRRAPSGRVRGFEAEEVGSVFLRPPTPH